MTFETSYSSILDKLNRIDPIRYADTRNYIDGDITYLSPYISRGVISTKQVLEHVLSRGYKINEIEKFVQELAWRDYWQQVWIVNKERSHDDLRQSQPTALRYGIPTNLIQHQTGIEAIDSAIQTFYQTGYLHNHVRMYIASMACNIAKSHWLIPAQWMYYYLLDADWASNAYSWQWVCGANSHKLYYANQENINRFCHTHQYQTFLDIEYDAFESMEIPDQLKELEILQLETPLPLTEQPILNNDLPTLIYNFYHLDPHWRSDIKANRILLLEPSIFKKYPISKSSLDFCLALAKNLIPSIQIWVAEFSDLASIALNEIYFKEHPLNQYKGIQDERDWLTSVRGDYPSFSSFWKKCKKDLFA